MIAPYVLRTPVLMRAELDTWAGAPVLAKAENLQHTGSYKVRGALNRVRTLTAAERSRGLVTASAGNAALAVAYAARVHATTATVVMPAGAVPEKRLAAEALGAQVISEDVPDATAAFDRAHWLRDHRGMTFVHPFDDPMVIAGAATATLELLQDHPEITHLYVPCSGGGLLAGAVVARDALGLDVELIGVQPDGSDSMIRSLAAGRRVTSPVVTTIADGLTAPAPGELDLEIIVDARLRVMAVDDSQIRTAMVALARHLRVIAEPAGAVALAGLRADVIDGRRFDSAVGVLISGGNVSWPLAQEIISGSADAPGR